ncbi:hypothetical protein [Hymenobacter coccineus]|uniref:Right handed beta helix domain-containing protein n=1 Tax=Hymenobacter coccineus TaxID=1908235 RepID=A0A1G1SVC6_9BACT|nr:hypothetical protein [Hymenobacter coccineus]OGX82554.1 hypothetical protein BEN49_13595 [Hymenobacter coccineus]
MRHFFLAFILLGCLSALLPGCEPKEDLVQTSGSLSFVQDTVLFDTVFTTVRTVTKRLWVYNRNRGALKTDINLAGAGASPYSLIISGDAGAGASAITVRGNDSLLILVRATVGDNGTATAAKQFVVADQINFLTNGNAQDVKLVAYGQNAYFHYGEIISSDVTWQTDKPHVIINRTYGSGAQAYVVGVAVAPGVTLRIPKGARIYSHAGATLQVAGRLLVNDLSEPNAFVPTDTVKDTNANLVRFRGDRLEDFYADTPGQWGGIVFTSASRGNRIRYAEIKNATYGLLLLNTAPTGPLPDVAVDNTTIKNISGNNVSFAGAAQTPVALDTGGGIISIAGNVKATNCLFANCAEYALLGFGGVYDVNFCTVANYPNTTAVRKSASLSFTDKSPLDGVTMLPAPRITLRNSIVWGSIEDELLFVDVDSYRASLVVRNSVLRTASYAGTTFATADKPGLADAAFGNQLNTDPLFLRSPFSGGWIDYTLQATSPALKLGPAFGTVPARDLRNLPRTAGTVGAYEHK